MEVCVMVMWWIVLVANVFSLVLLVWNMIRG